MSTFHLVMAILLTIQFIFQMYLAQEAADKGNMAGMLWEGAWCLGAGFFAACNFASL